MTKAESPRFLAENRWHLVAMAVVLALSFAVRLDHIARSLPYPQHVDEQEWVKVSFRMLRNGTANPKRFNYPSLPVYLMTAGFSAGLLAEELAGNAKSRGDLGRDVSDYYQLPGAAIPAKAIFAFASIIALAAAGYLGFLLTQRALMLWLVPLLAAISAGYFEFSWSYMNVDIVGAAFAWTTLAYLFHEHGRGLSFAEGPGALRRLVTLGVLSGLTVGCKYNLFPILFPGALWFAFYDRRRWLRNVALLGVVAVVTFFLTTPGALLMPEKFVETLAFEAHHYATGHRGKSLEPGLPMLWRHIRYLAESFGWLPCVLSLVGTALLVRRDAKLAALLFVWPVTFVLYMSLQRVFFERNDVAFHLFVALTLGVALVELPPWAAAELTKIRPALSARLLSRALAGALVLLLLVGLPWQKVAVAYSREVEPRNDAVRWLLEHKKRGTLLVDPSLNLDSRPVAQSLRVKRFDPKRDADELRDVLDRESSVSVLTTDQAVHVFKRAARDFDVKARFTLAGERTGVVVLER